MTEICFKMGNGDEELAPIRAHDDDAAFDLKSNERAVIHPGSRRLVKTGLFLELPPGFEAQIRPRSGLALKFGITVLNSPGTIDAGYRGEIGIILLNTGEEEFIVSRGDRIAQMVIQKLPVITLKMVENLDQTNRGDGGFGSTGIG